MWFLYYIHVSVVTANLPSVGVVAAAACISCGVVLTDTSLHLLAAKLGLLRVRTLRLVPL